MKKNLLLAAAFAMAATAVQAQSLTMLPEMQVTKLSNDGKIAVAGDGQGSIVVRDLTTGTETYYMTDEETTYYSQGFGRAFSDSKVMVGCINDYTPGILVNGQWQALPVAEGDHNPAFMNSADGITPDGRRICGGIAKSSFGTDAKDVMLAPVIWDRQADGTYGMYQSLPYPKKDFTGRCPQYVTARNISEDGKTIIGQIVDWSGQFPLPIVYRQGADGQWSYEIIAGDLVYNKDAEWPAWPEVEPKNPKAEDYFTAEDKAAYDEAYAQYEADMDKFYNGELEDWPAEPKAGDYISDPDKKAAYNSALQAYEEFNDIEYQFAELMWDPNYIYGPAFEFNTILLSNDGKYASAMYYTEEESEDMWDMNISMKAIRIDLTKEGCPWVTSASSDCLPIDIMDDGSVIIASPAQDFTRQSYIWTINGDLTAETDLYEWMTEYNPKAAALMEQNLKFNVYAADEEGNVSLEERIVTGSVTSANGGRVFTGWMTNSFEEGAAEWYVASYVLDLDGSATGINAMAGADAASHDAVYNLNGQRVSSNAKGMIIQNGKLVIR